MSLTSSASNRASELSRRPFLEERVYGDLRVAFNDQPFLLGSGFTLSTLRFWLLAHFVLLSHRFLSGEKVVPQPGIGPGKPGMGTRLQTAPVCQFQHWGTKNSELDAVAGSPVKSSPATAWFIRPTSAALLPLPLVVLPPSGASFGQHTKHFNNRIEQIAVGFGDVQGILDKRLWQSWYGHALKAFRRCSLRFARVMCGTSRDRKSTRLNSSHLGI